MSKTEKHIEHYPNGEIKEEGYYLDGKKDGKWTWWYDNGNKKSEGDYEFEEKDGLWTYYNEDGSKKETIEYHNGQEYICSSCDNKKGKITKQYCLSNPLNRDYKEEPVWEHYGGWNLTQMWDCRDFCKENLIKHWTTFYPTDKE